MFSSVKSYYAILHILISFVLNFYLRRDYGLLMHFSYLTNIHFIQQALGIVCVGIAGYVKYFRTSEHVFFLLMVTTFMIGTFILLVSCLASLSTATILSKTIYVSIQKNGSSETIFIYCVFIILWWKPIFFRDYRISFTTHSLLHYCSRPHWRYWSVMSMIIGEREITSY